MKWHNRRLYLAVAVAVFVAVLSACSSSGKATSASSAGTSSSGGTSASAQAYVAKAKAFVAEHLKPPPFDAEKAYTPPPGKTIGIVSAAQSSPLNDQFVSGAQAAAKVLGWKSALYDGKGTPTGWNAGIQQFVQQNVNGILLVAIADDEVPSALAAASAANIPVVSLGAGTLLSPPVAHPSFVSIDLPYELMGQMEGNYVVAASNGTAKVAFMTSNLVPAVAAITAAGADVVKQCAGCTVLSTTQINLDTNITPAVAAQTQSLLSQFGKGQIDYIIPPLDFMTEGANQALTATGRSDVKLVTNGCNFGLSPGLSMIRQGGPIVFCNTVSSPWFGWAGADQLGRRFAGLPTHNVLLPMGFWDTADLNSSTPFNPSTFSPFDYVSYYEKLWGA